MKTHRDPAILDILKSVKQAIRQPYPSEGSQNEGWHLIKIENGEETLLDTYTPQDGQNVMGCDMHEWMVEAGHYGDLPSEEYEWEGDSESVAIMAPREGMPEFRFEWKGEQP